MRSLDIHNIIKTKYHHTEKHNLDIDDCRYDRHWLNGRPNKKEIESNTGLKIKIQTISSR
jgi:hypothetical protein